MKVEPITLTLPDGTQFKGLKRWDGYITVTASVARKISVLGRIPRVGYEIDTKYVFPGNGVFPARVGVIRWTTYDGKSVLYIN